MNTESVQTTARERLKMFVGRWTAKLDASPAWSSEGHAEFEWFRADVPLLVQRSHVDLPEAPDAVAIIACDGMNDTYAYSYIDERDVQRLYQMTFDGRTWTLLREGKPFSQRFTGRFSEDGMTITGQWDMHHDGAWKKDFDVIYTKVG
jgi:hypothetical protein